MIALFNLHLVSSRYVLTTPKGESLPTGGENACTSCELEKAILY